MYYKKGLEINIVDMFYHVCKKWRSVIVLSLIFMIFAGLYSYNMPSSSYVFRDVVDEDYDYSEESLDKLAKRLSGSEKDEVIVLLQTYCDYERMIGKKQDIVNNYSRLRVDSSEHPIGYLAYICYSISDYSGYGQEDASNTTLLDDIQALYTSSIKDKKVITEICEASDMNLDDTSIGELYGTGKSISYGMYIYIYGASEDECMNMARVLERRVDESSASVKSAFPHTINLLTEYCVAVSDPFFSDVDKQSTEISSIEQTVSSLPSSLTAIQQAYYKKLLDALENNLDESVNIDVRAVLEENGIVDVSADRDDNNNLLFDLAIGALFGALFTIMWHMLNYVLSTRFKAQSDFSVFGLSIRGELDLHERNKGIFGFVDMIIDIIFRKKKSVQEIEEKINNIASSVAIDARKNGYRNLLITGVNNDKEVDGLKSRIYEFIRLKFYGSDGIDLENGESPLDNYETFIKMSSSDAIVLVEKVGVTKYEDISRMIELCEKFDIAILGAVVVS